MEKLLLKFKKYILKFNKMSFEEKIEFITDCLVLSIVTTFLFVLSVVLLVPSLSLCLYNELKKWKRIEE